jgi:hypothetical protein
MGHSFNVVLQPATLGMVRHLVRGAAMYLSWLGGLFALTFLLLAGPVPAFHLEAESIPDLIMHVIQSDWFQQGSIQFHRYLIGTFGAMYAVLDSFK